MNRVDTDKDRKFACGLPLAPSNCIFELCDEVDRLAAAIDRVRTLCGRELALEDGMAGAEVLGLANDILTILDGPS